MTPNTVYYWRVRAFNETSEYSGWSAVWTVRAAMLPPVLSAPADGGAALLTDRPEFDWEDRDGASGYVIQVSKVNTFRSLLLNKKTTTSAYVPTSDLPADSVLYWRVQASGANGPSLWSEVWSFTTGNPPSVPSLSSPGNKALTTDYTPRFDWSNSSVPAGTTLASYQIQVATEPEFGATVIDNDAVLESEFTPTLELLANTTFYWRVRSINTEGEYSGWSVVRTVRTAITPPVLSSPVGGAAAGSLKPVFDWEDAAGATSYTIQVSKVATFSSRVMSKTAVGSTYTPTSNLPAGQTLYWRVQAKGPNGPSAWSAVESFVTP
jgi:predicted phage tail protein